MGWGHDALRGVIGVGCIVAGGVLVGCGPDASESSDATQATDTAVATDTTMATDTGVAPTDSAGGTDATPDTTGGNTCIAPASAAVASASVPEGFCASIWADGLDQPRGIFVTAHGDVLVVERGAAEVTVLWDDDGDGVSGDGERAMLADAPGLNHGVFVAGGFLWASSSSTVFRWPYTNQRDDRGAPEVVIRDIPTGGHNTRTLVVDAQGRLYVSVGSAGNIDSDSRRSRIRRFDVATVPSGGIAFDTGEVFADGLRNEVGLAFDGDGVLWGVQNGMDSLSRADLGGDIHDDNPAEILSRFDTPGAFHGYPFCWAEFLLPQGVGLGPGTQWATPGTMNDGTHDDQWCRNTANVDPPELAMQAHSAPLDLEFYDGAAFPASYAGDLFVAFHGSWNRDPATGYKVVHIDMDGGVAHDPVPFFEYSGQGDIGAQWPHRPVGVRVAADGRLLVTSDASGVVIAIGHDGD